MRNILLYTAKTRSGKMEIGMISLWDLEYRLDRGDVYKRQLLLFVKMAFGKGQKPHGKF